MVDNKIKGIVAWSSAQFAKVRSTMAKDRHHADMALKHAAQRMRAALNAHNALQDKGFKQTVANIKLAKAEAKARVDAATSEFKMNILHLQSTVKHQVFKLNSRVTALQGVITKNKLEQAKVNRTSKLRSSAWSSSVPNAKSSSPRRTQLSVASWPRTKLPPPSACSRWPRISCSRLARSRLR